MNLISPSTLANCFPGYSQVEVEPLIRKRSCSAPQTTNSSGGKRRMTTCNKPVLHVNCTVSPHPTPQLVTYLSPSRFPLDPRLRSPNHVQYSSGFLPQQSYVQQSTSPYRWGGYAENFQSEWTSANVPHVVDTNFVEMCQSSVVSPYSVYTEVLSNQNPFYDDSEVASTGAQSSLVNQAEDPRDTFIKATVSRLESLRHTLAREQQALDELLEVAALLIKYGCVAGDKT